MFKHPKASDIAGLVAVLAIALTIHGWIAWHKTDNTVFTDSMDYLFMADFYRAAFHGDPVENATIFYRVTRFPPVFPLLLGMAGAGTDHQHIGAIVSSTIAVLAALAVWVWVRREYRSAATASFVAIALLLFPYHFLLSLTPVVEPIGILLMAVVFALLASPASALTPARLLTVGLLIGIAPLARTAMLPLSIAFVIWLAILRPLPWRQLALPVLLAWAPFVGWFVYRKSMGARSYTDYLTSEQFSEATLVWPDALWQQPVRLFESFVNAWGFSSSTTVAVLAAIIAVAALVGCLIRIRQNQLDGWFLAGYIALILIWPFPEEMTRFLVAAYPCMLVCCMTVARNIDRHWLRRSRPVAVLAMCLAVAAASTPAISKFTHRAMLEVDPILLSEKREMGFFISETDKDALVTAEIYARGRLLLEEARGIVPDNTACMYALPPQLGRLYSRKLVVGYPMGLEDADSAKERLAQCDYFFLGAWSTLQAGTPPLYPMKLIEEWTEPVLMSFIERDGTQYLAAALVQRKTSDDAPEADDEPDTTDGPTSSP